MVLFHLNTQSAVKHARATQIQTSRIVCPDRIEGVYADLNPNPAEASADRQTDRQQRPSINKKIYPS